MRPPRFTKIRLSVLIRNRVLSIVCRVGNRLAACFNIFTRTCHGVAGRQSHDCQDPKNRAQPKLFLAGHFHLHLFLGQPVCDGRPIETPSTSGLFLDTRFSSYGTMRSSSRFLM